MLHLVPIFRGAMSDLLTPLGDDVAALLRAAPDGWQPDKVLDASGQT